MTSLHSKDGGNSAEDEEDAEIFDIYAVEGHTNAEVANIDDFILAGNNFITAPDEFDDGASEDSVDSQDEDAKSIDYTDEVVESAC